MKKNKIITFIIFLGLGILIQLFQNCGRVGSVYLSSLQGGSMSLASLEINHPGPDKLTLPKQRILVGNKVYVSTLMRNIFSRTAEDDYLEAIINQWIMNRPAQFGGSCSTYDSYSQRDCGGDVSNVNLAPATDDNTLRESFRLQFCRNTLGKDDFVSSALSKVSLTTDQAPNSESLLLAYSLFYQDQEANPMVIDSLLDLDRTLMQNSEPLIDRWRAQLLMLCESPGWQLM